MNIEQIYQDIKNNDITSLEMILIQIETRFWENRYIRSITVMEGSVMINFSEGDAEALNKLNQATSNLPDGVYKIIEDTLNDGSTWPIFFSFKTTIGQNL